MKDERQTLISARQRKYRMIRVDVDGLKAEGKQMFHVQPARHMRLVRKMPTLYDALGSWLGQPDFADSGLIGRFRCQSNGLGENLALALSLS